MGPEAGDATMRSRWARRPTSGTVRAHAFTIVSAARNVSRPGGLKRRTNFQQTSRWWLTQRDSSQKRHQAQVAAAAPFMLCAVSAPACSSSSLLRSQAQTQLPDSHKKAPNAYSSWLRPSGFLSSLREQDDRLPGA
jgi:hypothetical protein